jgi:type II secretory pathway pseudopilin PulG
MAIRKKHIIRHYTIVEVMVAMGVFLVMMTIMMQFFTSAQKVWNLASKRNMMYADARVAMNLMTRELQSMLYDNDNDGTGIYPFWYQWTTMGTTELSTADNYNTNYLTALNFIATTDIKAVDTGSDVCEIRYKFVPVYFDTTPTISNAKGGKLVRCCVAEYYDNNGTATITPSGPGDDYNFANYSYLLPTDTGYDAQRVFKIWPATVPAHASFDTVITGVYSLKFTCYAWFQDPTPTPDDNTQMITLESMDESGNAPDGNPVSATGEPPASFPYAYNLATGTPVPVAIRIDMKLMDPKDLKKLAYNIYVASNGSTSERKEAEEQIKNLKQTMRTFSKVIYLGKNE